MTECQKCFGTGLITHKAQDKVCDLCGGSGQGSETPVAAEAAQVVETTIGTEAPEEVVAEEPVEEVVEEAVVEEPVEEPTKKKRNFFKK